MSVAVDQQRGLLGAVAKEGSESPRLELGQAAGHCEVWIPCLFWKPFSCPVVALSASSDPQPCIHFEGRGQGRQQWPRGRR